MIKPDVKFDEITKDYVIQYDVKDNGKFFVSVQKRGGEYISGYQLGGYVGLIEGYNGAWKVSNDPKFETGVLIKAVKRCIDNYLRYIVEYKETLEQMEKGNENR